MNSKEISNLMLAYQAVYDQELREQFEEINEDFFGVEYLTEENLEDIAEEVIYEMLDEGYDLTDIEDIFEEFIVEAKVTYGHDTQKPPGRLAKAFKGALEKIKGAVKKQGEKARASAIASTERANARNAAVKSAVGGLKDKIKGKIREVSKAVRGGVDAAKKEHKKEAKPSKSTPSDPWEGSRTSKKPTPKVTTKSTKALPPARSGVKVSDPWRGSETSKKPTPKVTTTSTKALPPARSGVKVSDPWRGSATSEKPTPKVTTTSTKALPPRGKTKSGKTLTQSQRDTQLQMKNRKLSNRLGEEVEAWVNQLVEEGYDLSGYTWDEMTEIYLNESNNAESFDIHESDIVEVATEYFYSYGLNEDGIDILIEKVGLQSFVEYVYDLSEDLHVLTEAKKVKKSYEELKKEIYARDEAKQKAKEQAKAAAAKKKEVERKEPETRGVESQAKAEQPKSKKPVRDAIARSIFGAVGAYKAGMERHKAATATAGRLAGETAKTVGKVISTTHEAGRRAGEHVRKHGLKSLANEEVEAWVNQLVEEGYDLSGYTWDEMTEIYESSGMTPENRRDWEYLVRKFGPQPFTNPRTGGRSTRSASRTSSPEPQSTKKPKRTTKMTDVDVRENIYNVILSYLLDEGYAKTVEQAEVIMVNMSEGWRESIVEAYVPYEGKPQEKLRSKQNKLADRWDKPGSEKRFHKMGAVDNEMIHPEKKKYRETVNVQRDVAVKRRGSNP